MYVIIFMARYHDWPRGNLISLKVFVVHLDLRGHVKEVVHVACHICQYCGVLEVYRYSTSVLCSAIAHISDWYSHMCCVITPHFDGVGLMMATKTVSGTSDTSSTLTWLITQEDFTESGHCLYEVIF
jgi:hypothetical protein